MARRKTQEKEEEFKPPIERGEVTPENPSGIEKVSDEHAMHIGSLRGHGGPGAAGATVAGPVVHVATEGGTRPLPVKDLPEGVETIGGETPDDDTQPTSQEAALKSGTHEAAESGEEHNADLDAD